MLPIAHDSVTVVDDVQDSQDTGAVTDQISQCFNISKLRIQKVPYGALNEQQKVVKKKNALKRYRGSSNVLAVQQLFLICCLSEKCHLVFSSPRKFSSTKLNFIEIESIYYQDEKIDIRWLIEAKMKKYRRSGCFTKNKMLEIKRTDYIELMIDLCLLVGIDVCTFEDLKNTCNILNYSNIWLVYGMINHQGTFININDCYSSIDRIHNKIVSQLANGFNLYSKENFMEYL